MLGRLRWGSGRTIQWTTEEICGLPILTLALPEQKRKPERMVERGAQLLRRNEVKRVLVPPEFPWWSILGRAGLRPVETGGLRCALAPTWVIAQLNRQSISPESAVLCLKGEGLDGELERVARNLCPVIRNLMIDAPGGRLLAERLRKEYGMPVLPIGKADIHLTLCFNAGPVLTDAQITLPRRSLPEDCDRFPLVAALWETGRIKTEEIRLEI